MNIWGWISVSQFWAPLAPTNVRYRPGLARGSFSSVSLSLISNLFKKVLPLIYYNTVLVCRIVVKLLGL